MNNEDLSLCQRVLLQANEQVALLHSILESSTEYSILTMDLDGVITAWNEGARRLYGYGTKEITGKANVAILHLPEDVSSRAVRTILGATCADGKWSGELPCVRKNGTTFTAYVTITLRRDTSGEPIGYLQISKDITEQKTLESQLQSRNQELEQMYRRAREESRLKSAFLANMSHELRTPLNSIIGFTELMHKKKVGPISLRHEEYLGDILASARHLLQLINDVLDLSKIESGKMDFRPQGVDLVQTVQEVADIMWPLVTQKRIELKSEIDSQIRFVVADPAKLKQILYNYVSNALKFTPDRGRVTIRGISEPANAFRLEVEDTGIGIEPDDISRLFAEYQQLDASASEESPGSGLGLALTKRIVEAQGGAVGVRSTPGRGSTFFAVLPCGNDSTWPSESASLARTEAQPALSTARVLCGR